jgi:hypothetical protein
MPLTQWTRYRQTRAQKKKALHLLALSGVVRPSTLELRYAAPPFHNSLESSPAEQPDISQNVLGMTIPPAPTNHAQVRHLAHQLYSTAFALLAESRRCIQKLQWDGRTAA